MTPNQKNTLHKELLAIKRRGQQQKKGTPGNTAELFAGFGFLYINDGGVPVIKNPAILNPRTARFREALIRLAQKFDEFPTFSEYYWNGLARNTYWIGSNDENFAVKELEKQYAKEGRLIAYIHPEMIKEPYAVEVDLSYMNPMYDVTENPKDPTNSIKIIRPDLIKVRYVTPVSKAIKIWEYNSRHLPSSQYELLQFWKAAQAKKDVKKPLRRRRAKIKTEK